jgi:hypothetical protein
MREQKKLLVRISGRAVYGLLTSFYISCLEKSEHGTSYILSHCSTDKKSSQGKNAFSSEFLYSHP